MLTERSRRLIGVHTHGRHRVLALFDGEQAFLETVQFVEEQGGAGLWRWDIATGEMRWSRGFFTLLGVDRDSIVPSLECLQRMTHPEDVRAPGEFEALIAAGGGLKREFRIIQPSGRVRWLSSRGEVLLDRTGSPARVIGLVLDVTQQHETRARADALQARLSAIMDSLGAATWCTTPDGRGIDVLGWCKMTGQAPSEAIGLGWLEAVHPEDRPAVADAWREAVDREDRYEKEFRLRLKRGEYRRVRARAAPVRARDGKILEWVGITMQLESEQSETSRAREAKLTGSQLRAGRALLNWSVKELAEASGVSASTIRRLEEVDWEPKSEEPALPLLRRALEKRGVAFQFPAGGTPSVGLNRSSADSATG